MSAPGFRRVFVANRGTVAVRVARTCDALGIEPVFGVSEADADAPWVRGRETVCLGPARASESYLAVERVVQAAVQTRCSALHPGWGFLSESPLLAALCAQHGVTFVGPAPALLERMGRKVPAKQAMAAAGLPVIPGSAGVLADRDEARRVADEVGYPVLLKAESGGGGRGMRVVHAGDELERAWASAEAEAAAAFGDGRLYLEKLIEGGRHVEVQVLGDRYGHAVHLGERDCSVQRQHQKLVEEAPAPTLPEAERRATLDAAARAAAAIGYGGAGTLEFLLVPGAGGGLRFMEMNARLQVEHGVSELCWSQQRGDVREPVDLVEQQLRVAAGQPLGFQQADLAARGHALQCRINAEDPERGFQPSPGRIEHFRAPREIPGRVRVETHVESGYRVSPHYDSLLCKLLVWAETRDEACERMLEALGELECRGVATTAPLHRRILASREFRSGHYDTRSIPGLAAVERASAAPRAAGRGS